MKRTLALGLILAGCSQPAPDQGVTTPSTQRTSVTPPPLKPVYEQPNVKAAENYPESPKSQQQPSPPLGNRTDSTDGTQPDTSNRLSVAGRWHFIGGDRKYDFEFAKSGRVDLTVLVTNHITSTTGTYRTEGLSVYADFEVKGEFGYLMGLDDGVMRLEGKESSDGSAINLDRGLSLSRGGPVISPDDENVPPIKRP